MVQLSMIVFSSSIKFTSFKVDIMFWSKSVDIFLTLGLRNKSYTRKLTPNVSLISPITLAANNECLNDNENNN